MFRLSRSIGTCSYFVEHYMTSSLSQYDIAYYHCATWNCYNIDDKYYNIKIALSLTWYRFYIFHHHSNHLTINRSYFCYKIHFNNYDAGHVAIFIILPTLLLSSNNPLIISTWTSETDTITKSKIPDQKLIRSKLCSAMLRLLVSTARIDFWWTILFSKFSFILEKASWKQ